jgi:hypothetical protein
MVFIQLLTLPATSPCNITVRLKPDTTDVIAVDVIAVDAIAVDAMAVDVIAIRSKRDSTDAVVALAWLNASRNSASDRNR